MWCWALKETSGSFNRELPTTIVTESKTPPQQPNKPLFDPWIELKPADKFHIYNFVGWTTFVGLYFFFVADEYGWVDSMLHNEGGFWYDYFIKMVFFLTLIAVVLYFLSLAFVRAMLKYVNAESHIFFFILMCLLNIMAISIFAQYKMFSFEGSWFDGWIAFKHRVFIYGVWVLIMMYIGKSCIKAKKADKVELMVQVLLYKLYTTSAFEKNNQQST